MDKISEIFNFNDIGSKIKNFAKRFCWTTILLIWISAPIAFIVVLLDSGTAKLWWIPLVTAIVGPAFIWVSSWTMYAFGEFVEDIHAIREKHCSTAEKQVTREAEEITKQETEKQVTREAEEITKQEAKKRAENEVDESVSKVYNADHSQPASTNDTFEKWKTAYATQGKVVGLCGMCGKKKCPTIFAEFEDLFGKAEKNMCYDCYLKYKANPKM